MYAYIEYPFTKEQTPKVNMGGTIIKYKISTFIISGYELAELFRIFLNKTYQ